ncbi:MAG: ComEC/Rec2 family competence protein [Planctomycetota bacterium]|jgi:competence protein ComEC
MDDIQRRLELIDRQLAGQTDFYKQLSTSPLLFAAVGLIAGILIQNTLGLSIFIWLMLLTLCTVVIVLIFVIRKAGSFNSYAPAFLTSCALICFMCLGAICLTDYQQPKPNDIRNFVADDPKLATVRGIIITEPYVNDHKDWKFARFKFTDPGSSFYLQVKEAETTNGWAKTSGTVRVQVTEPVLDLKTGDYIQAYCWLDRFRQAANPGQFDTAKYLALKNVFIAASIKSRDAIETIKARPVGIFTKIKSKIRQTATNALIADLSFENQSRGLLQALLLGYRGNIDSATYRAFRKTGLLHFISLSGMHLGILIGIVWWLCKIAGLMKRSRAAICIIAIILFLLVVPPRPPTLRAAIIGFVFCASFLFRRSFNSLNTLSLAAMILLLIRPTGIYEPGWQLSFASVLSILLFCKRTHFFMYEKLMDLPWHKKAQEAKPFYHIVSKLGPYLLRLFSTGLTAWLGGAGILLYHFYTINPVTSIWTVLAFPFVAVILTIGFLKIILSFLLPTAAAILAVVVNSLSDFLIWLVNLFAHLDISQILIGRVSPVLIIFYYCLILFAAFVYFRRPLIKKVVLVVSISAIIIFLGAVKWQRTHRNNLIVTVLDAGHGQAILAQLPGTTNILFDVGSLHAGNIGSRTVMPFLTYNGINRLGRIIISHNDVDHINGIPEIAESCRVDGIYANNAFFSKADRWGTAKFLKDCLLEKGYRIRPVEQDLNLTGSAKIKNLWPNEKVVLDENLDDNDKSLVSLIEFAGRKILLCSDTGKFSQNRLLQTYPDLQPDVVVVPHHGSARTLEADFLKSLDADTLIYSCSRSQYEKRQTNDTTNKTELFYTPKDGAVTIHVSRDGKIKTTTFIKSQ